MKLEQLHSTAIDVETELGTNWLCESYVPFSDGRLVMLGKRLGKADYWLIQVQHGKLSKRQLPAHLHEEMLTFADAFWDQQHLYRLSPKAFAIGEKLALLLADRKLYVFDDIAAQPVPIDIDNVLAKWSSSFECEEADYASAAQTATFFAEGFGPTRDQRVPVMFRGQYQNSTSNFLALLSVDLAGARAHWEAGRMPQPPMTIRHGPFLSNTEFACFSHVAWQGDIGLAFGVGNMEPHFRCGMQFVELWEIDARANVLANRLSVDEACYGQFSADLKWLLLTPMYKKYARKGKQTALALDTLAESSIVLPRGCSKLRVVDIVGEHAWLVEEDRSAVITCRIAA